MNRREINPELMALAVGGYSQAVEVTRASRLLFISGQIPEAEGGLVHTSFAEQCDQVCRPFAIRRLHRLRRII